MFGRPFKNRFANCLNKLCMAMECATESLILKIILCVKNGKSLGKLENFLISLVCSQQNFPYFCVFKFSFFFWFQHKVWYTALNLRASWKLYTYMAFPAAFLPNYVPCKYKLSRIPKNSRHTNTQMDMGPFLVRLQRVKKANVWNWGKSGYVIKISLIFYFQSSSNL